MHHHPKRPGLRAEQPRVRRELAREKVQSRRAARADLGAQQWGRKKAAAQAAAALAKTGADALAPHAPALAAALLAELPGRLWDGKEALLDALAALAAAAPAALAPPAGPGEAAVVAALTAAAERRKAAYVAAALRALETALAGLAGDHFGAVAPLLLGGVARSTAALGAAPAAADDVQARRACRAPHPDVLIGCKPGTAWAWLGWGLLGTGLRVPLQSRHHRVPYLMCAGAQEGKGEEGEAEARPPPLPETVRCLAGAWARASAATAAAHGAALARALAQALNPGAARWPGCAAASLFHARTPDEQRCDAWSQRARGRLPPCPRLMPLCRSAKQIPARSRRPGPPKLPGRALSSRCVLSLCSAPLGGAAGGAGGRGQLRAAAAGAGAAGQGRRPRGRWGR